MTQEEKQLLLQDLCARLPYGVIVHLVYDENTIVDREMGLGSLHDIMFDNAEGKPYLRPLESMTEDEITEIYEYAKPYIIEAIRHDAESDNPDRKVEIKNEFLSDAVIIDELIKRHLDYRGLIPMGLALKAPQGMYN